MKTFLVLSDSHGRRGVLDGILPLIAENDYIVHLGDGSADMKGVFSEFPQKTYLCRGNCDFAYGEEELVIQAEGRRIFCCHGHRYGVKSGISRLVARAKQLDCDITLYGHTHRAAAEEIEGVLCINPGAAGAYAEGSYCYLVLYNGKATHTFVPIRK